MSFVIDAFFTTTTLFGFVMMGSFAASIQNIFKNKKEDNRVLRMMNYVPRIILNRMKIQEKDSNIAITSFVIAILIINFNGITLILFG